MTHLGVLLLLDHQLQSLHFLDLLDLLKFHLVLIHLLNVKVVDVVVCPAHGVAQSLVLLLLLLLGLQLL